MTEEKPKMTPNEAINEFYQLKNKYETSYYEKYIKPILKNRKSKKEKRREFSRLPKNECVNCKRNVGTIFTIYQDSKQHLRKFVVKCGDLTEPCPLDIQIEMSFREQFYKAISDELRKIEEAKLKIIKEKNNALFFNKPVLDTFENLTQELKELTQLAGFLIETNILKNNNPEKEDLLYKTIDEFGKGFITPFKQMVNEYVEKNDELKLTEAIRFYINEMIPKLKEIQELKYDVNQILYDDEYTDGNPIGGSYRLIQYPNSLENTEFTVESDDNVIKFVKGIKKVKKAKTMKKGETQIMTKTRKLKPTGTLVIEEEEVEVPQEEQGQDVSRLSPKEPNLEGVPNYDASNGVVWDNKLYNTLWSRVPKVLKDELIKDKEWLQEYMENCVKARQSGKRCELILPSRTKLPPEMTLDDNYKPPLERYDFGVELINKVFNKLDKPYKDRALTMYSEKDGVKNYSMLRNLLTEILEKQLMPGVVPGYY